MRVALIPSAAYVCSELAAEYGRLPAAFLPMGHKRLYELQIQTLREINAQELIYLTVPKSYEIPIADQEYLAKNQVHLIKVPDDLRLAESILFSLEIISDAYHEIVLLHGDTLIYDLPPIVENTVAIGVSPDSYTWGSLTHAETNSSQANMVLAGFFTFGDAALLRRSLAQSQGDFVKALDFYGNDQPLTEFVVSNWLDFGHLQTFYRARCEIKTHRSFNELSINFREIYKTGSNEQKIEAEALWFDQIPLDLRMYTPALLGYGNVPKPWYKLEYLPNPSLHELLVFGELNVLIWRRILDGCFAFLQACIQDSHTQLAKLTNNPLELLVFNKTLHRLQEFFQEAKIDPETQWSYEGNKLPSLLSIAQITAKEIKVENFRAIGLMHGDLCFTNIFYDFRTQKIQVIDPRGTLDGVNASIFGDVRYDMAKLNHSLLGGYDFILANRYDCTGFDERDLSITFQDDGKLNLLESLSNEFDVAGVELCSLEIQALTIHLFLSMLPLHDDRPDRQKAFLANALRLFSKYFK